MSKYDSHIVYRVNRLVTEKLLLAILLPRFTFLFTTRQTLSHVVGYSVVVILHTDTCHPSHTHMHFPIHSLFHSFIKLCSIQKSQAFHMQHLNNCNYINVHYTWVMQYTVIIFFACAFYFLELTSTFLLLMVILLVLIHKFWEK